MKILAAIVLQFPHDHAAHKSLAELLIALKHRPSPEGDEARTINYYNGRLWKDLPEWKIPGYYPWSCPTDQVERKYIA